MKKETKKREKRKMVKKRIKRKTNKEFDYLLTLKWIEIASVNVFNFL